MNRPIDWQPLADTDPVGGDPVAVEQAGDHYLRVAEAIEAAAASLQRIADATDTRSEAVRAFGEKSRGVADLVLRAQERYAGVGTALGRYSLGLTAAQRESSAALVQAKQAWERQQVAMATLEEVRRDQRTLVVGAEPMTPKQADVLDMARHRAEASLNDAADDLVAAQRRLARAVADRDEAAETAAAAIRDVEDSGDLRDSWWDNWGKDTLKRVTSVAGTVAAVAGVLSLAVGWIPVIGQALAAVLGTVALIAGVISLVGNLVLLATGDGSWVDVGLDVVSLATFGVGRAVAAPAEAAQAGARATARLDAGRAAALSPAFRAAAGLPANPNSATAISEMVGPAIAAQTRDAARTARSTMESTGWFQPLAGVRTAVKDVRELPGHVRTLANAGYGDVGQQLTALLASGNFVATTRRLLTPPFVTSMRRFDDIHAVLRADPELAAIITRARVLVGVGAGAQIVGGALDTFQLVPGDGESEQ